MKNKCLCGCGKIVKKGSKYISGHNNKGRTYEELYGDEKAKQLRLGRIESSKTNNARYWLGKKQPLDMLQKRIEKLRIPCSESKKEKISKTLNGHNVLDITKSKIKLANLGKHNSIETEFKKGYKLSKSTKEKIRKYRIKKILPKKDTSIEVKIQNFLKQLGIEFYTHQYIRDIKYAYQCDIFIPVQEGIPQKTIIECDGDYWHGNPEIQDYKTLSCYIKSKRCLDFERTNQLEEQGFRVIRLWEHEIKNMEVNDLLINLK